MANAHHDAAKRDQRSSCKTELFGPEQGRDGDVTAGFELAICLDNNPATQVVKNKRLVGLRKPQFPWNTGVLDTGLRRGAGATVMSADEDYVGMRFGDAGGDRAHPNFGHELNAHSRVRVRVLQIMNQLSQILDRVNIVVRWWRNKADTGS